MKKKVPPPEPFDTIITSHANADFDAMASMLAAQKLYPDARVVFPGTQEKSLRIFFINSMVYLYNMAEIKDIDLSRIKRLVLVDTRQADRIGALSMLVGKPDVEIHIYDHHPSMADDIRGQVEVIRPTGATITILTEILEEKNIPLTPEEATVMCLGIYEDTGSFCFASTTESDFKAAAALLARGANLNVISDLISRELNPQQLHLLNEMFQSVTQYTIHGVDVVVTSLTTQEYIPDFAFLVHKMIKMENMNAVFAIACMGNKIYVVARSRVPEVDAAEILRTFGGGGHRFAASATLRDKTIPQAEQLLLQTLREKIPSRSLARDLMSSPAISIPASASCGEARKMLTRYNINALMVLEQETARAVGFISRQVIEKAIFHKLAEAPVRDYMTSDFASVRPEADLFEIQQKIIENKQRILPVMEGTDLVGVISRTDLLNTLIRSEAPPADHFPEPTLEPVSSRSKNVAKLLSERLPPLLIDILKGIGETADRMGVNVYAVGGFVRDLFLYRQNEDVDVVVEGDGIAFAKAYAATRTVRIHPHAKFGTAVVIFPDGFKIDVASARVEYYDYPAALPNVETGSIKLDMFRRDFTINTMAVQLNAAHLGTLVDFFSGQRDIKEKAIKVLHNLSFVEDPTRVFRALRFEQRFGFTIGKLTSHLIENAVKMDFFKRLSGRRVFSELKQILEEEDPAPALLRMRDYDLLKVVHPSIVINTGLIQLLAAVKNVLAWYDLLFLDEPVMRWAVYLLALLRQCDADTARELCARFELPPRHQGLFSTDRFQAARCLADLERRIPARNSTLYKRLIGFKTELIAYMMAATRQEKVKKAISHYFTSLRKTTITLQGKDLKTMGLKPGPAYREILGSVLAAKLDGRVKTRDEELSLARSQFPKPAPSPAASADPATQFNFRAYWVSTLLNRE